MTDRSVCPPGYMEWSYQQRSRWRKGFRVVLGRGRKANPSHLHDLKVPEIPRYPTLVQLASVRPWDQPPKGERMPAGKWMVQLLLQLKHRFWEMPYANRIRAANRLRYQEQNKASIRRKMAAVPVPKDAWID